MRTGLGMNERGVASSVGSLDLYVGFDHVRVCRGRRSYRGGKSCGHGKGRKVAPREIPELRIILLFVILIFRHSSSIPKSIAFRWHETGWILAGPKQPGISVIGYSCSQVSNNVPIRR